MLQNPSERITAISIAVTTTLGTLKVLVGILFSTVAFLAAGLDALFDTLTSILVMTGLRISTRPPDRCHRYGHRQAETIVALILAAVLVIAGVRVAWISIERIIVPVAVQVTPLLVIIALVSTVVLGLLAMQKIKIGRRMENRSVVADGYHTLTDAVSSLAVLVGAGFIFMGHNQADAVVGLFISCLIGYLGVKLGKDSLEVLMGASPGEEVVSKMRKVSMEVKEVKGCHKLRARRVGSKIVGDLHVQVRPNMSVKKSHEVATKVERRLRARIPDLSSVVVHVEPVEGKKRGKNRGRGKV